MANCIVCRECGAKLLSPLAGHRGHLWRLHQMTVRATAPRTLVLEPVPIHIVRDRDVTQISVGLVSTSPERRFAVYLRVDENMNQYLPVLLLLLSVATLGQTNEHMIPQTVEFPSGTLHLKAYLWKPAGPGPFPARIVQSRLWWKRGPDVTAGMQITESADILPRLSSLSMATRSFSFRRGHGPSADQSRSCKMSCVVRKKKRGEKLANAYSSNCSQPTNSMM